MRKKILPWNIFGVLALSLILLTVKEAYSYNSRLCIQLAMNSEGGGGGDLSKGSDFQHSGFLSESKTGALKSFSNQEALLVHIWKNFNKYGNLLDLETLSLKLNKISSSETLDNFWKFLEQETGGKISAAKLSNTDLWKKLGQVKFENRSGSVGDKTKLGTEEFLDLLKQKLKSKEIGKQDYESLRALGELAGRMKEKLDTYLFDLERTTFKKTKTFLSQSELEENLKTLGRKESLSLMDLGYSSIAEWRHHVLITNGTIKDLWVRELKKTTEDVLLANGSIPETEEEFKSLLRANLPEDHTFETYHAFMKIYSPGEGWNKLVDDVLQQREGSDTFAKIIDNRIFSESRREKLLEAVKEHGAYVVHNLGEGQPLDPERMGAAEALANYVKGIQIVSPSFNSLGKARTLYKDILNKASLYFLTDPYLVLQPGLILANMMQIITHANPLVGLDEIFDPTQNIVMIHNKVLSNTRASMHGEIGGNGVFVTTGKLTQTRVRNEFAAHEFVDQKTILRDEENLSVLVVQRTSKDPKFGFLGAAEGNSFVRAPWLEATSSTPAGLFYDGKIFMANGEIFTPKKIPYLILPDLHIPQTDPKFFLALRDYLLHIGVIIKNPEYGKTYGAREYIQGPVQIGKIITHDVTENSMFSHHVFSNYFDLIKSNSAGVMDMKKIGTNVSSFYNQLADLLPETEILNTYGNHDMDWTIRKVQDFLKGWMPADPSDAVVVTKMIDDYFQYGTHPFVTLLKMTGLKEDRVRFIKPNESVRVFDEEADDAVESMMKGGEVGQHGDRLARNGGKSGGVKTAKKNFKRGSSGHIHTSGEDDNSVTTGTGMPNRLDWHTGPSNVDASIVVGAPGGMRAQVIRMVRGTFTPSSTLQPSNQYFPRNYPRIKRRTPPPVGGATSGVLRSVPRKRVE